MTKKEKEIPKVGPWAQEKLDRLEKYLSAYTKISSKRPWAKTVYVDAFAAAGKARIRVDEALLDLGEEFRRDDEARQLINGSPARALAVEPPFNHYVFIDRDPDRVAALEKLKADHPNRQVSVRKADCNDYLRDKLVNNPKLDWKKTWRAVVFLDPFGMQVPWGTIESLAKTGGIEVFINFPVGMAINRLLKRTGKFTSEERSKLDEYFGDPGWFEVAYPTEDNLFGTAAEKAPDAGERLLGWYRERLKVAFGNVSEPLLVRNTVGGHLYYLIFAGPNETGAKIATDIMLGIPHRKARSKRKK